MSEKRHRKGLNKWSKNTSMPFNGSKRQTRSEERIKTRQKKGQSNNNLQKENMEKLTKQ